MEFVLSIAQAKQFAFYIYRDIRDFVDTNSKEYQEFLISESRKEFEGKEEKRCESK